MTLRPLGWHYTYIMRMNMTKKAISLLSKEQTDIIRPGIQNIQFNHLGEKRYEDI